MGGTLTASALVAQDLAPPPIPVDTFSLANGLRLIVSEDHSTPVVAVNMWYRVGSAHEPPGRSGFAHFFEHLLFEETEHLDDGEMDRLVSRAGGVYNGTTNTDRTAYYEILPSNRVNLAFFLHRERMANLVVSQRGFDTQREVVKEEKRLRLDNQPYVAAQLLLDSLSSGYEPYEHPPIGTMEDLDAAALEDVRGFYERYYVPNNATLVVAGDVTVEHVRALAEEYFGDIPRGAESPTLPAPPALPRADGPRRSVIEDRFAQLPLVYVGYTVPGIGSDDLYALTLLANVLGGGESSRIHRRLVKEERAAPAAASLMNLRKGPGLVIVVAIANPGVEPERVESLLLEEVERVVEEGITERELEKAKNQVLSAEVNARLTVEGKAAALQEYDFYFGDPFAINGQLARFEAVTLEEVARVARTYLTPGNRTVVVAEPAGGAG